MVQRDKATLELVVLNVFSDDSMHAYLPASPDANGKMSSRNMSVPGPQNLYLSHQAGKGSSFPRSDKLTVIGSRAPQAVPR